MGLPLFQERRLSVRKQLTGLMPGRLQMDDGTDVVCDPKDVSSHGLGIISKTQIPIGSHLILKMKDGQEVRLLVSWGQPGFGKRDEIRFGLVTEESDIDLEEIFAAAGCLK